MPPISNRLTHIEIILLLTAFAAGSVDVISFADLGGVFASAMTGNFALLAYYVARSDFVSAMGSVVALTGFVVGCAIGILQRRGRPPGNALNLLLASESGLLLFFALYGFWAPTAANGPAAHLQIALLALAMGMQAIVGQTLSSTTIVFTATLTKMVGSIADSIADRNSPLLREVKIQGAVVIAYLFGALLAGALIVHEMSLVVILPVLGVAAAFIVHIKLGPKPT